MTQQPTDPRVFDPFDTTITADPYPWYAALRRHAPVHHIEAHDMWVVSRHVDVRTVLGDSATFSNEAMAAAVSRPSAQVGEEPDAISIIGLDGEEHGRLRRIVNRGFTPGRIADLTEYVTATVRSLLTAARQRASTDIVNDLAAPLPNLVIGRMLGVRDPGDHDFPKWSEAMVHAVFDPAADDGGATTRAALDAMNDWLDTTIEERVAYPGDDLVSVLVRAQDDDVLTPSEMRTFVFTLLVAGSFTTQHLISNTMRALLDHPTELRTMRENPSRVDECVEEGLRFDPPAQWMLRTATCDVEIADGAIPAGSTVLGLIGAANRDGSVFENPEEFTVARPRRDHLAFGHGAHHCLGAALARLEARIAIRTLIESTDDIRAAGPPERLDSFAFRGLRHLPVEVDWR